MNPRCLTLTGWTDSQLATGRGRESERAREKKKKENRGYQPNLDNSAALSHCGLYSLSVSAQYKLNTNDILPDKQQSLLYTLQCCIVCTLFLFKYSIFWNNDSLWMLPCSEEHMCTCSCKKKKTSQLLFLLLPMTDASLCLWLTVCYFCVLCWLCLHRKRR